jgi:hypothetical protein
VAKRRLAAIGAGEACTLAVDGRAGCVCICLPDVGAGSGARLHSGGWADRESEDVCGRDADACHLPRTSAAASQSEMVKFPDRLQRDDERRCELDDRRTFA